MIAALPVPYIVAVLAVTLLAAVVQGSLGLGLALVASPGLSLVDPTFVPGPILAAALVASTWTMARDRQHGIAPNFRWTLVGIPLGIPIGLVLLSVLPTPWLMLGLGLTVLTLAPMAAAPRLRLSPTPGALGMGGFLSAVAGSTVGLTGPTVAIVYNQLSPHVFRMTMALYLTIVQSVAMAALIATGGMSHKAWVLTALTVPGTIVGLAISGRIARGLRPDLAKTAVVTVCCIAGASLTLRAALDIAGVS